MAEEAAEEADSSCLASLARRNEKGKGGIAGTVERHAFLTLIYKIADERC